MSQPDIEITNSATVVQGKDGIATLRAYMLASSLRLYANTGLIPTRGVTITKMLQLAAEITQKPYKRGDAIKAADDVQAWADTMKLGLKIEDKRGDKA